jgi:pimeloyl-ACP methyl ester carboxylesterase
VHLKHGFADVNGTRLYYEMAGSGPALVLIHGHTLDTRMWDDQFEPFARDYRVIRYDQRGYGKSALPTAESYSPADDLMAVLRYLGLSSAHILGQSRGGAGAIDFALTYPEATTTLIAVDAVLRGFQWTSFGTSLAEIHSAGRTSGVEAARQRWLGDALFAASLENPRVAPRLKQIVGAYSGWAWVNNEPLRPLDPPSIQQLDKIRIPTLVVVGDRDVPDFLAIADILHQRIPNASKVVMAGVGHMSNMEDPELFNRIVLSFLSSNSVTQRS